MIQPAIQSTLQPPLSSTQHFHQPDVAIFLRGLYGGGAERVMLNLARGFIDRGLTVDLVLARAEGSYCEQIPPEVRVIDLKAQWVPASLPKLVNYLRKVQPTTLLTALHYPCEIAVLAKQLARVPTRVIVSEHNTLSLEAKGIPQLSVHLTPLAARLFYPWADRIVAVSHGVADDLAQLTRLENDRIQVIYNPIVSPQLFKLAQESVNHPWFKPGEPPVIISAGRLHPQKDFPTLIRAFSQVRQQRSARLIILGDGPEREPLTQLIHQLDLAKDIDLPGFVQNPYAYIANAAVFALSSAWEGLGNVLVEAMAVRTPIVSTNCESGPAEILANGKFGQLTPVGDSAAMAEAILKTLEGYHSEYDSQWLEQFTLETCVQQYLNILELV